MNVSLTKRSLLILGVLLVALLCSSCGGGGSKGGSNENSNGGGGIPVSQDPSVCAAPIASQPTGIYAFLDSTITVANGATLFRYAGVDGNANPLWQQEQSPYQINNEGQYEFKATMTGLTDSEILKVQYTSYTWRLAGTQGGVSTSDVKSLSMAVDDIGIAFVAYSQNGFASVKRFNGSSWVLLGSPDFVRSDDVIVAMDGNVPYLAYADNTESVRVKKWNGSSWVDVGGIAGRVSSNGNLNGNHHFSFDVSNGRLYTLSLSPISGKNVLMKFDGTNWIELGPILAQTYYYFAMDAANGKPYVVMANKGGRPRVMLYDNGWVDLVNPNETPILNCTVDATSIRIANNNFNVDISVDDKTNTVYFLGDYVNGAYDDFKAQIVRNGRIIDVSGMGSDDPDDLNILAFNGRAVLAYEGHDNYVGYDPAGINFEFIADGGGSSPSLKSINKQDKSIAYIDGSKLITMAGGGNRLFVAFSDGRLGGRATVLTYLP